jgi:uncharacterized phage-associated protein
MAANKLFKMPYSASVIAFSFVQKGIIEGKPVTQMKLQKMVFFAHGYHLAKYGTPLINEEFEAWKYGPVVQSIYRSYKLYGSDEIKTTDLITDFAPDFETIELAPSAIDAINYTWKVTKNLSASQLSTWSHKDGSPWSRVYNPDEWSIQIGNNIIEDYFKGLIAAPATA